MDTVNYPDIRLFMTNDSEASTPLADLKQNGILLPWSIPSQGKTYLIKLSLVYLFLTYFLKF